MKTHWTLGPALLLASGCQLFSPSLDVDREEAGEQLDLAETEIRDGVLQDALERLVAVREVEGLDPDMRARDEELLEEATALRLAELDSSEDLEELYDQELPNHLRARAGILAAERMLREGRRVSAFKMIKKVDKALPSHPERVLAGDVVARAGLDLIRDERRYWLLFRYRTRGIQALEYLVLHYPLDPRCPEAYFALSETYERTGDLDLALERAEDLVLYHPADAVAVAAEARLPYLRLSRLERTDFDRGELLLAHDELQLWLERHAGHELEPWVRTLERECQERLVENDLYLAGYYERTKTPYGTRLHAERALETARGADLEDERADAEGLLERVSEIPSATGAPTEPDHEVPDPARP
jgi:hypothetical protein